MNVKCDDYEQMFDSIDELYKSLRHEFYKHGSKHFVDVDMTMAKMKVDMLIGALRNVKKIKPYKP